jgi:hypothetical protein
VPTQLPPKTLLDGARIGRCHGLPEDHALAFAMGTHARLGAAASEAGRECGYLMMPADLVRRVVEACAWKPEGEAGNRVGKGAVRLIGGVMRTSRSTGPST